MRIVYIITLIFCYALKASASESPKLTFLPEGALKYIRVNGLNGSYTILRSLKEFKVGAKYCLWGSDNWDDACQDAAMEYAYGSRWPEFKQVALEFLELTEQDRLAETAKLFEFGKVGAHIIRLENGMDTTTVKDASDLEYYASVKHLKLWRNLANGRKYKEFFIDDCFHSDRYCVSFSKNLAIHFNSELEEGEESYQEEGNDTISLKYHHLPKIISVIIIED